MYIDERINVIADVTVNGFDMKDATVSFASAEGGSFAPASGASNSQGNVISTFTPDEAADETITYEIVVSVTKAGLTAGAGTVYLVVEKHPIEYLEKDKEYHLLTYRIRERLLDSLAKIMEEDPDLYKSTGATDPPRFLNGFSYTTRDFPQIVMSGGAAASRRVGIGNSVGNSASSSYPTIVSNVNIGGWYDLTVSMTVIAESKSLQEALLDKCIMILFAKEKWNLYAVDGILVLDVSVGPGTTQPYGSRLLYSGTVNLKCATEWFLKDRAKLNITKFTHSLSI